MSPWVRVVIDLWLAVIMAVIAFTNDRTGPVAFAGFFCGWFTSDFLANLPRALEAKS